MLNWKCHGDDWTACRHAKKAVSVPTTTTTTSTQPSFYQRKLPETCVAFASFEGKNIFKSALEHRGLKSFYNLIEQHHTQTEPAFCGLSTLVLVLNALAVDPGQNWKGPWRWYEENMLNCCVDIEEIKQTGITLKDFRCLAFCQGLTVDLNYCDGTSSIERFRETVERACNEEAFPDEHGKNEPPPILECLVVSYSRKILKQTGDGHFSPLAAYDKESDSVLILDTARFKYGAHWTKLPLMYEAMKEHDSTTGKSRGYALLSFTPPPSPVPTTSPAPVAPQPASILYRSLMNQKRKRKHYKEYIRSLRDESGLYCNGKDIPYEVVRSYWCEERNHPSSVWEIILPMRVGTEEEKEMLRKMRLLLADLHHATVWEIDGASSCNTLAEKDNFAGDGGDERSSSDKSGTSVGSWQSSVSAEETLYIIYLATLSEKKRHDFVMNFDSPEKTDVVRKQVIKEADIIASAIEVSDQLTSL